MRTDAFHINSIKLTNYKNYAFEAFDFSEKLNLIIGNNGLGKTNLLDAVYYSCFTKSYLTSSDLLVARLENDFFRIETSILSSSDNQLLEIKYLKKEKKEIWLNRVKLEKQSEFIGKFPCVIITPDDNQLILGGSEIRRRFMDATLCQLYPEYLHKLVVYYKILVQRNALLKSFFENRTFDKPLLDIYTDKLVECGQFIHDRRRAFTELLNPVLQSVYTTIFHGNENVSIAYDSDFTDNDYRKIMADAEGHDRNATRTTKGVHTDDLLLVLNDMPVKKMGSQGQQKTYLLSLKLAQYELLKREKQLKPLLLLDDIFDKLDADRIGKIFKLINSDDFGQVFITDTDEVKIKSLLSDNHIVNYKIIKLG